MMLRTYFFLSTVSGRSCQKDGDISGYSINKKAPGKPGVHVNCSRLLRGLLGKGLDGLGREADTLAVDLLGLKVHGEGPAGGDVGMAALVAGACTATGQLTYSAHIRRS